METNVLDDIPYESDLDELRTDLQIKPGGKPMLLGESLAFLVLSLVISRTVAVHGQTEPGGSTGGGADMVLLGGKVVTVDPQDTIAQSLAIKDGKILHVGDTEDIRPLVGRETRVIQLDGKTVLPGFIDAHTHIEGIARYALVLDVHVPPLKSVGEILERVKTKAQEIPKGTWIEGRAGWGQVLPSREDLDAVAPEHPVCLVHGHDQVLNSKALEMANITKDTSDPKGGKIWRDPETGEPTGELREMRSFLPIPPPSYQEIKNASKEALHRFFVQQGVTSIYDAGTSPDSIRMYQELLRSNELPARILLQIRVGGTPEQEWIVNSGFQTGFGNDWLKLGGIKIIIDGEGRSAARYDPPGQKVKWTGLVRMDQQELNRLVLEAHQTGFQVWVHGIGDKAQDMALDAFELALKKVPRTDHRHRIEHAGNGEAGATTIEQIDRMRRLGVIPVPTAAWLYLGEVWEWAFHAEKRFIYRTLLDRGLRPPGSSDSAGTMPESINPLFSIWCEVARKTRSGELMCPEEAITVMEAIRTYTIDAAYSGFEEKVKGSIEKGKFADLIILSDDPLTVPVDEIRDINVETTIVGGKIVYQKRARLTGNVRTGRLPEHRSNMDT